MDDFDNLTDEQLLERWEIERSLPVRNKLYKEMESRELFPSDAMKTWEEEAGLYPDSDDPRFIERLMMKQEFIENRQESYKVQQENGADLCNTKGEFELTSVQRFISRFLSPQSPYQSALLYHGVGVGKTCAAIVTAEEYLHSYPTETVFIVAPRNIQPGFRRTIFDEETLVISKQRGIPNSANGCTGNTYLERTETEYEIDRQVVIRRINQSINTRYKILGYIQFARYIQEVIDSVQKVDDPEKNLENETAALQREFNGRFVIIDEAHNLRDTPGETEDDSLDDPAGEIDMSESKAGKRLTPVLLRMLSVTQGMKLMLLTGTPMYNSYKEILFLFNLLLTNDKKGDLKEHVIFEKNGKFQPEGEKRLGNVARAYLSFMRGENPLTFPVRLKPENVPTLTEWPTESPQGEPIVSTLTEKDILKKALLNLPFVPVSFEDENLKIISSIANNIIEKTKGLGLSSIDEMVQSGNWLFPAVDDTTDMISRIRDTGFNSVFKEVKEGISLRFQSKIDVNWLTKGPLKSSSPKTDFILNRIEKSKGVIFIYSRFIRSGALPIALALEANGYTRWGNDRPFLTNPNLGTKGRQCALCDGRERSHSGRGHPFTPAKYVLLTGQASLSPNNAASIKAARGEANLYGKEVKVVIGSQVASEGIDLRFIREIYVFDSWFHLNKMEQVLGRGVRTCSHSLLNPAERNCTIYLLVNTYGNRPIETADLYMYRSAMMKAIQIGKVTRILKTNALDCNLNIAANYAKDLNPIERMEDAQGNPRENVEIKDTPYTSICDWTECSYTCSTDLTEKFEKNKVDYSTYDEYAMSWRESQIKQIFRDLFKEETVIEDAKMEDIFKKANIPQISINTLLKGVVDNRSFRLKSNNQEGYIIKRNGFYLFQPILLADVRIPLALRVARVPVGRDEFTPIKYTYVSKKEEEPVAPTVSGPTTITAIRSEPSKPVPVNSGLDYWRACIEWANQIRNGNSPLDRIPADCMSVIDQRYSDEMYKREFNVLTMISWMYENIQTSKNYSEEDRTLYRKILADTFLEIIWDESINFSEQIEIVTNSKNNSEDLKRVTLEQALEREGKKIFRYVNPLTGGIEYMCGKEKCSQAEVRILEKDTSDPVNLLEANRDTTGKIYGFIIPKIKEGKLVLKTNDVSVNKGIIPNKGKECENVSTISGHKKQLVEIREILLELGYPSFLLIDSVLNEKDQRDKPEEGVKKKKLGERMSEENKMKDTLLKNTRKFQNVVKACSLKNIILRMLDKLERSKRRKRYFYRPIATIKSKHKLK